MFKRQKKLISVLEQINENKYDCIECSVNVNNLNDEEKRIADELMSLSNSEITLSSSAKGVLAVGAKLSEFDVGMRNIAEKLDEYTEDLTAVSEENMAIVEETTSGFVETKRFLENTVNRVNDLSKGSNKLVQSNEENMKNLAEVMTLKKDMLSSSEETKSNIMNLVALTKEIEKIVESVQGIARQTNLLALNASIEAARVGEHGKGFAVVAEQIRILADETQNNLAGMTDFVSNITGAANGGLESTDVLAEKISIVDSRVDEVTERVSGNIAMVKTLTGELDEIKGDLNSIEVASAEIEHAITNVADGSQSLIDLTEGVHRQALKSIDYANRISTIDDELMEVNGEMASGLLKSKRAMDNTQFIGVLNGAIESHLKWVDDLRKMVKKMNVGPLQTNDHKCGFGHFYHIVKVTNDYIVEDWLKVDNIHKAVHFAGDEGLKAIKAKDSKGANESLLKAEEYSEQVIGLINVIIGKVNELSKKDVKVFEQVKSV